LRTDDPLAGAKVPTAKTTPALPAGPDHLEMAMAEAAERLEWASWEDCHSVGPECPLVAYSHPGHRVTMRPNSIPSIPWPLRGG